MTTDQLLHHPDVDPAYCKGCSRCVDACAHDCIELGTEINPLTGLTPVVLNLDHCTNCGMCLTACPEPYGMHWTDDYSTVDASTFDGIQKTMPKAHEIPNRFMPIEAGTTMVIKGTYASAIGAILAGCRHFYGYPITPSTEGTELMAKLLPQLDGVFIQAVSEVAAINMLYGTGIEERCQRCLTRRCSGLASLAAELHSLGAPPTACQPIL